MSTTLQIQLFGGLRVALDGKPIDGFYAIKAPALLAYLAVTRRTPTRDSLAALFWGEMPDVEAKTNLRQCLANLRKLLEPFLHITRDSVEFNFDAPYTLDVEQFETFLRAENLGAAVELYKGDFLDGVFVRDAPDFEEWTIAQRARLRELLLQALHTLVEQSARRGDAERARGIDYATRLLALDPWREETHRALMLMLARMGQRSVALEQYQVCQRVLAEGLGVAPSVETTALYERIRAAGDAVRHNLPAQATSFVGRAKELDQIENALRRPECRLVTLHGGGGIGKTRLAIQAAERALKLGTFLNGVYFVPLDSIDSIDLLAPAIAEACGFTFSGKSDPKTQVTNFLREKEILLVLDNFEHLLDAATWLGQLLTTAPSLKLLVTSRERLNLKWEWIVVVEGLEYPDFGLENRAENLKWTAVDLFVERARQAQPDFQIDQATNASIARVCQLVDGMPLGIELAAAWVATHSMSEIVREIEHGYNFLATTQRDAPARQRSLRAVFEYAWNALAPDERAVFSRLAIFRGGWTREAAKQIAGASVATLNALVNKSLVRVNAAQRYSLHEIVLQYADEKLGDARAEMQIAHARYFADWMQDQSKSLHGAQERQAIAAINVDLENVHAAWWHAIDAARYADIEKFLPGLHRLYDLQSRFREGEKFFGKAAEQLARAGLGEQIVAKLLARQASLLADLGQSQLAIETLQRSLTVARRADDPAEIMFGLKNLGNVLRGMGKYEDAKLLYSELLALSQRVGASIETAAALNNLAVLANTMGDRAEAKRLHQECLSLRREIGDRAGIASSLLNLATVTTNLGEYAESESLLQQALAILSEFGDRRRLAAVYTNLGAVAHRTGRNAAAKEFYQHALALHRETGLRMGIAIALNNVGSAACDLGEFEQARTYLIQSLKEAKANQLDFVALDTLVWIATLWQHEGKRERAVELLALVLNHRASDSESLVNARQRLAQLTVELTTEQIEQAQERGRALTLEQALDELIE